MRKWTYRIKRKQKGKRNWVVQLRILGIWFTILVPHTKIIIDLDQFQSITFQSKTLFKDWKSIHVTLEMDIICKETLL